MDWKVVWKLCTTQDSDHAAFAPGLVTCTHKLFTSSSSVAAFLVYIRPPLSIFYCIHQGKSFLICIIPYDLIRDGAHSQVNGHCQSRWLISIA